MNGHTNRSEVDTPGPDRREVLLERNRADDRAAADGPRFCHGSPPRGAPVLGPEPGTSEAVAFALDMFIWALFAADLAVKVAVAPRRAEYLRQHWLEVLVVLIPFARPLRILRLIVFGSRAYRGAVRLAHLDFLAVYAIGLVLIVATIVMTAERGTGLAHRVLP